MQVENKHYSYHFLTIFLDFVQLQLCYWTTHKALKNIFGNSYLSVNCVPSFGPILQSIMRES